MPGEGTCSQCGAPCCIRCVPDVTWRRRVRCPRCRTSQEVREAPEQLQALYRDLWCGPLVLGVGAGLFSLPVTAAMGGLQLMLIGFVVCCMPFFLLSLVLGLTRSLTAAWISFAVEMSLPALLPSDTVLGLGLWLLASVVPMITALEIRKIRRLEALLEAHGMGARTRPGLRSGMSRPRATQGTTPLTAGGTLMGLRSTGR